SDARLSVARRAGADADGREGEPGRCARRPRGHRDRRPQAHRRSDQAMGVDRRRRDQLHREHGRDDPTGGGPRESPSVRGRGHAALPAGTLRVLFGTAAPHALAAGAPAMERLDTDVLTLPGVQVLQVIYEMPLAAREPVLPPALHPTDPPLVSWLF